MIFFLTVRRNAAIASSPHWYPMRACQGDFSPLEPSKGGGQNMGKSNRFIQKKFRLTEQENFILEEKLDSTGLSLQTYVVRAALGVPIFPLPPHLDDRLQLIYRSLRNIQGNINQIAHALNSDLKVREGTIADVLLDVTEIGDDLKTLIDEVRKKEF